MMIALLLAALPMIFWDQGPETAPVLKQNGIEQVVVPAEKLQAWKTSGVSVRGISPTEWTALEEALAPGVDRQVQVASATRSPYLVANGWRFIRNPSGKYRYSLPAGKMMAFLRGFPAANLPGLADIAVIDDQHPLVGEVMNLLARRNLLFTSVPAPSPRFPINIRVGSKEYPEQEAANPSNFALTIRRQLTDDRRTVRIYGSETVLCRLTGDETRIRLHLVNYRGGKVDGLRIRLLGAFRKGPARGDQIGEIPLDNFMVSSGSTEFTIPAFNVYAVVDLQREK